ncbi:MAG TPA: NADH-quinone oxidoreductase subunit C [Candidatus Omnitrophota bacterium]|nr:NADH-quinone oxidoreductase subunit C [Candidatus Omnitrophota bacterium]HRY85462.1 NADH-quinone oxidoreductase subunit C [Candidatus Omnitrophota bacterium]
MDIPVSEVKKELEARLPDVKLRAVGNSLLVENPDDLPRVALFLKENPKFLLDYLSSVTGADYLSYLESVYHLYSMAKKHGPVALRVRVPKNKARIPSLVTVYRSAELQEREAYDTFGIIYEEHPDLRRLFMWEDFEGHPLRKDYAQEDSETLEAADIAWLEARGVEVPPEMKEKAKALEAAGQRAVAQKPEKPRN